MALAAGQDAFAAALLDPGSPVPSGITSTRGGADEARFAVYRNNVFVGLTNALARRFPVTDRLVGAAFFHGMARAYAQERRPASPLMFAYGGDFPEFIAAFAPAASLSYLPDVARLEAAWTDAYHAADAAPVTPVDLGSLAPERLETARLTPHPAARLIRSNYPIGTIWGAHQGDEVTSVRNWQPETVLVARPQLEVRVHVVPARDAGFAAALLQGETLGEAGQAASSDPRFDFGAALVGLVSLGAFSAIDQGEQQ